MANEELKMIEIKNESISCKIATFAAALASLCVKDRDGKVKDVVIGYDTAKEFSERDGNLGAVVGRCANRICDATFDLNGKTYQLDANNGKNSLHGGFKGFGKRIWEVESLKDNEAVLKIDSPDGDGGYPGSLTARVRYALNGNTLTMEYTAESDKDTLCNLTNHAYFNLNGHEDGTLEGINLRIDADGITLTDEGGIPTGEIEKVAGTPFDFTTMKPILRDIDKPHRQTNFATGYDINFTLTGGHGKMHTAAEAVSEKTGICMKVETTLPGMQFYTANKLGERPGKGGAKYGPRSGFCLESQVYPDAIHHDNFPSAVLKAGEKYHEITVLTFSAK